MGQLETGDDATVKPYGTNVLITGSSGGGKSTLALAFIEGLAERKYQFLIVDPEGDYSNLETAVVLGDEQRPPNLVEVTDVIARPNDNVVVNLVGLALKERPMFFEALFSRLQEIRTKTGRPHWILIDEAHHVLPASWDKSEITLSHKIYGLMMITLEPDRLSPTVRSLADLIVALGDNAADMFNIFTQGLDAEPPQITVRPGKDEALCWFWRSDRDPFLFRVAKPKSEQRRHRRKYVEGELDPELSFYFRGPEKKLNLRAQNLTVFLQIAEGIDNETWLFHLRNGDISGWFGNVIKDPDLAAEAARFERDRQVSAEDSRARIREEIEKRYILAA